MNKWTLASLRAKAEQIEELPAEGEAYRNLTNLLDTLSREGLELLANAGIKWFSTMAKARLSA